GDRGRDTLEGTGGAVKPTSKTMTSTAAIRAATDAKTTKARTMGVALDESRSPTGSGRRTTTRKTTTKPSRCTATGTSERHNGEVGGIAHLTKSRHGLATTKRNAAAAWTRFARAYIGAAARKDTSARTAASKRMSMID